MSQASLNRPTRHAYTTQVRWEFRAGAKLRWTDRCHPNGDKRRERERRQRGARGVAHLAFVFLALHTGLVVPTAALVSPFG